jgi:ferredoxin-NADP reductase
MGRILRNGELSMGKLSGSTMKVIMISLGTGIAPFLTILGEVLNGQLPWELTLFHSSRYMEEVPMGK